MSEQSLFPDPDAVWVAWKKEKHPIRKERLYRLWQLAAVNQLELRSVDDEDEVETWGVTYRRCQRCRQWMRLDPVETRSDRRTCSNTCRTGVYRKRKREKSQ